MRDPRWPMPDRRARWVEDLLGLDRNSLRRVETRANGDIALIFRQQIVGDRYRSRRVLRIPRRRALGYQKISEHARERDVRARRRQNNRRFAFWLEARLGLGCPVVKQALIGRDYAGIDELRAHLIALAAPMGATVLAALSLTAPNYVPKDWSA